MRVFYAFYGRPGHIVNYNLNDEEKVFNEGQVVTSKVDRIL